jgi:hypothetical protein
MMISGESIVLDLQIAFLSEMVFSVLLVTKFKRAKHY